MSFTWIGKTVFWWSWWHWYIGAGFQFRKHVYWWGIGHHWAPRYCITWLGPISYWHMHSKDEKEFTSGWEWNREPAYTKEDDPNELSDIPL